VRGIEQSPQMESTVPGHYTNWSSKTFNWWLQISSRLSTTRQENIQHSRSEHPILQKKHF